RPHRVRRDAGGRGGARSARGDRSHNPSAVQHHRALFLSASDGARGSCDCVLRVRRQRSDRYARTGTRGVHMAEHGGRSGAIPMAARDAGAGRDTTVVGEWRRGTGGGCAEGVVRDTNVSRLTIATLVLLPMAWTGVAFTQQVSGVVQVNNTAMPSTETSVALIDSAGVVAAITITSSNGGFTLRAPAAGTYRIRARRIGFLPDSSKFLTLTAGQRPQHISISLNAFPVQLVRVGVEEARRCVIAPQAGATVFRLWQEAQSALTATAATSDDAGTGFVLHRFERKLDPR